LTGYAIKIKNDKAAFVAFVPPLPTIFHAQNVIRANIEWPPIELSPLPALSAALPFSRREVGRRDKFARENGIARAACLFDALN
jgi:hypothetical protein